MGGPFGSMQPTIELRASLDSVFDAVTADDAFVASAAVALADRDRPIDALPVLERWAERTIGGPSSSRRYRWSLGPYIAPPLEDALAWRPREAERINRDPIAFVRRLWTPIILADTFEWLARIEAGHGPAAALAGELIAEAEPRFADELAGWVAGHDVWAETFALWVLTRRPRVVALERDLVFAIAARQASRAAASGGVVLGRHFPFHEMPLPSASAHLGVAIAALGVRTDLLGPLVTFLLETRRLDGGWGDPGSPTDLLTTLAAADLLAGLEPSLDPGSVVELLPTLPPAARGWTIIGPEAPFVAAEVSAYLDRARLPFAQRFRWPQVAPWAIDPHVGIARFDAYLELARVVAALPGLGAEPVDVAFIDIAGLGAWNNAYGMEAGDGLLMWVARQLRTIPLARPYRDGGDEFLVVGAPGRSGLAADVAALFEAWPASWAEAFGDVPVVPPRGVVGGYAGRDLVDARGRLSRALGELKHRTPKPGPTGVLEVLE